MAIKIIKMVSGDEIICECIEEESYIVMKNPHQISMVPSHSGQPAFGLLPYPISSNDKEIKVKQEFVILVCNPIEDFVVQYKSITGVGIMIPHKDIILG
jgi:hypothetical protein